MKGKTKEQKGITLIALIITIVVLLILAAVAISSITNDGILGYATNAAKDYNQAVKNEQDMLENYIEYLDKNIGTKTYSAYEVGDIVKIGEEEFYVIKASDATAETVELMARENIDTTNLVQSSNANIIEFSATNYWSSEFTSSPYDLVETGEPSSDHYAAYAAYKYGAKLGGTGRLMTYNEANTLRNTNDTLKNMIFGTDSANGYINYWLGTAFDTEDVWSVYGKLSGFGDISGSGVFGVRPVVSISKSLLS